jgi:hypothetical protein
MIGLATCGWAEKDMDDCPFISAYGETNCLLSFAFLIEAIR